MDYPKLPAKKRGRMTVSGFDGGLGDDTGDIGDNQLTRALNLWWHEGRLRTRPGIRIRMDSAYPMEGRTVVMTSGGRTDIPFPGGTIRRFARSCAYASGQDTAYEAVMTTVSYDGSRQHRTITPLSELEAPNILLVESGGGGWEDTEPGGAVLLVGQGGRGPAGRILAQPAAPASSWTDVTSRAYVPLVMINGRGSESTGNPRPAGTVYEGYNLLTPRFRARFTTENEASRFFYLPVKQLDDDEVEVRFTDTDGSVYAFVIPAGSDESETNPDGIQVRVNRTGGYVYCYQPSAGAVRWFPATGVSDNLEITASKTRDAGRDLICSMRICTWFGGDRSEHNGGARLFVSGHRLFPNLVHWSDVNNPLYFPENNYAYIGDSGQAVTAFAKQGERLVIFKEREIYCASYTAGTRTARYLPDGSVVDATSNQARFPIAQLHPFIGCDCPDTIQLCDNSLVWANSGGRVYALAEANRYSESSVRAVSPPISRLLGGIDGSDLKTALSGDYLGHYILMTGRRILLLDYTGKGYSGYLQNPAAGRTPRIPWMYWSFEVGIDPCFMMSDGDRVVIGGQSEVDGIEGIFNAVFDGDDDMRMILDGGEVRTVDCPIEYECRTKLFDLGLPRRKDVTRLYLECKGQSAVRADCYDENGLLGSLPPESPSGLITFFPNAVRVRRLGLGLSGIGQTAIGSLTICYKIYGKE